jgi:hypothetical protein
MNRQGLLAVAFAVCTGSAWGQGGYTLQAGVEYSRGDYGTDDDTEIWSLPVTLGYAADAWSWSVTVPWLVVRGTGEVLPSGPTVVRPRGGGGTPTPRTTVTTESGLGDVSLRGSVRLREESQTAPWMGLTAKAKLGTADESRDLGTGENDYAMQLDLAKGVFDGFVGYRVLGDTADTDYDDVAYGSIAVSFETGPDTLLGVDYYLEEAALADGSDIREASLFFVHRLDGLQRVNGYLLTGFTDASPDWGLGVSLSHAF